MDSLQDKLEFSSASIRRKLFDNNIAILGQTSNVIRIKPDRDKYGDENTLKIVSKDIIECIIFYPGEVPLSRGRSSLEFDQVDNSKIYLYDILPISLYTKFADNVEKYDFIIHTVKDEEDNETKMFLQVSEIVGSFKSSLMWKKCQCAPYNGVYTKEIENLIK